MKTALMYSGGLDSACAFWLLDKPDSLYFGGRFGPARFASVGELRAIARHKAMLGIESGKILALEFDFRPFMRVDSWTLPRHQIVAMLAWARGYDRVLFGWCKEDGTSPANLEIFRKQFEGAVGGRITVDFPVMAMGKAEMIKWALGKGAPLEFLHGSYSCTSAAGRHCGRCRNCKERRCAFIAAGCPEPKGTYTVEPADCGCPE